MRIKGFKELSKLDCFAESLQVILERSMDRYFSDGGSDSRNSDALPVVFALFPLLVDRSDQAHLYSKRHASQ